IESLTERELQVARLVVDRKTNPQIAAELFLSQKTIETHLRNIFRKADVTSRVGLARAIQRPDRTAAPSERQWPRRRTVRGSGAAARPARDEEPLASPGAATADGGTAEPLPVPPSCPDPPCTGVWRRGRHRSADGVRACLVPGVIGISPGWQAA